MITPIRGGVLSRTVAIVLSAGLLLTACGGDDGPSSEPVVDQDETTTTAAPTDETTTTEPEPDSEPDETTPPADDEDDAVDDGEDAAPAGFPLTIDNCGVEVTIEAPPERAVTMNQAATEVMLSLGLEDHMVGTAYLDDEILPELAGAFDSVPVLSDGYPSTEALYEVEPDFVYGSYASAFREDSAGERDELHALGVGSYLSLGGCPVFRESGEPLDFEGVFGEISDIAAIFGVPERAEALIADQQELIDGAELADAVSVLWWDDGFDAPSAGACCGSPGMLMRGLGLENLFESETGSWATVSWEQVIDDDPDVIVVVDASWSTADDKVDHLRDDAALQNLSAVTDERMVVIPFSATTPGVRNAPALAALANDIREAGIDS